MTFSTISALRDDDTNLFSVGSPTPPDTPKGAPAVWWPVTDSGDDSDLPASLPEKPEDGVPTVTCSRCDRTWTLDYELDELHAGNRAVEQFAKDHYRHTCHYPDEVTPWLVACRECPEREQFLAERPARRHARTHARHTRHTVEIAPPDREPEQVGSREN
jgi:hypothetical protein